ncbi:helix-turn-helix domain-containing protein [Acerihabitans sp. TG2]|uniref:winged helix-turn-helix transcriptional regulator n=1 Tax=Acerihabitans sp. TG2 TaxID=3096008 RepID=UPI002B22ADB2|nr:helix-turn-helix domain-containing protein [Acerihabitans sp. TG2]MEA9391938.1 helix-turn-helix domain-containing protein [Acerihabitans sp. TG2]
MQRKHLGDMPCPIAQSLELVGEWWSILILRDAFRGLGKFDEFQRSLGVSPTILTRRLKSLVTHGILYKHAYSTRPLRFEYLLTERGEAFFPVMLTLLQWGNQSLAAGDVTVEPISRQHGMPVTPVLVDDSTHEALTHLNVAIAVGANAIHRQDPLQGTKNHYETHPNKESL